MTRRSCGMTITSQSIEPTRMLVTVEDTGTGLDSATAARIFDPFFTTKSNGMGMGLRICLAGCTPQLDDPDELIGDLTEGY